MNDGRVVGRKTGLGLSVVWWGGPCWNNLDIGGEGCRPLLCSHHSGGRSYCLPGRPQPLCPRSLCTCRFVGQLYPLMKTLVLGRLGRRRQGCGLGWRGRESRGIRRVRARYCGEKLPIFSTPDRAWHLCRMCGQFRGKLLQLGVYPRDNCWRKWTDEKVLWNLRGEEVFKEDCELRVRKMEIAR